MTTKLGNIKKLIATGAVVLLAVLAVVRAENPPESSEKLPQINLPNDDRFLLSLEKTESPYEILTRNKGRQGAEKESQAYSIGPVVAKARFEFTSTNGGGLMSYLASNRSETTSVRPPELREAPPDAPSQPAYFQVKVGDRNIHGVTYRSTRDSRFVKLLLDTNGDGLFSDEREYLGSWMRMIQITVTYYFGPVATQHGDVGIEAGSFVAQCSNGEWLVFYPAIYREGQVLLDGKKYKIALVDNDFDGKYNRFFVPPAKSSREPGSDAFAIDLDGDLEFNYRQPCESELMPLSRLVKVNDTYYSIEVAENGSTMEFRKATPQFGQIDFGGEQISARLWSDIAPQWLKGTDKTSVPAGRYGAVVLELAKKDSSGDKVVFTIDKGGAGELGDFEVRPGQVTSFQLGPPFQIKTSMERSGENVFVSFSLQGRAGELYKPGATINDREVPEPAFRIIDESGKVVHSGRFEYG
jgi:hypothetical protein